MENCRPGHSMKAGFILLLELRVEENFTLSTVRFSVLNLFLAVTRSQEHHGQEDEVST